MIQGDGITVICPMTTRIARPSSGHMPICVVSASASAGVCDENAWLTLSIEKA